MNHNCFDISPNSEVVTVAEKTRAQYHWVGGPAHEPVPNTAIYQPQNAGCAPVALGDLNNDGCVDRADLTLLMTKIQARSKDLSFDLNGDGKVDVADARFLVLHFSNRDGSPCTP